MAPGAGLMPADAAPDGGSAPAAADAKAGSAFADLTASQPVPAAAAGPSAQVDLSALAAPVAANAPPAAVQSQIKVTPAHGDVGGSTASSPAAQVAPALASITQASDGSSRLTLRLDPAELGHVQIRIDRPQDAPARVEITADRPETLALLQRDQPQLQRALDQAGVPADRSLTFHAGGSGTGSGGTGGQGAFGAGTSGQSGGGSQGWAGRSQQRYAVDDQDAIQQPYAPSRWMRAGLDITA
jgi:hypothetical protein